MKEQRERKGIWKKKLLNCDLEEKAGLREPQTTVEIQQNLGQPNRELQRTRVPVREVLQGTQEARPWYTNGVHHWLRAAWEASARKLIWGPEGAHS